MADVFVAKNKTLLSPFLNISLYICKRPFFKSIFVKPGLGIHPFPIIRIGVSTASAGYMIHILPAVIPPKNGRNAAAFFIEKIQECFRDEITLHGTITDYGQAREGDGYHDETAQGRPLCYAAGVITGIDSILDGGAFSSKWVEPKSDGHEHLTLTGMGENRRNGETNKFSKFVLNYYPDDGFYQMFIFLFGNKEKECYYPGWDEDRYEKVVEVPYPYGEYHILLVSDFDARMGGPKDEGSWY